MSIKEPTLGKKCFNEQLQIGWKQMKKMENLSRETDMMEYQTNFRMEEYNNQTKKLRRWAHQQDGEDKKKKSMNWKIEH